MTDQQVLAAFLVKAAELVNEGRLGDVRQGVLRLEGEVSSVVLTFPIMPDGHALAMLERACEAMRLPPVLPN